MYSLRKVLYIIWSTIVISFFICLLYNPTLLQIEQFKSTFYQFESYLLLIYILVSFVRGFFLIPSTPFVIGGAALFPSMPHTILLISMLGVLFSASMLYYFSDLLKFSDKLEKKYPSRVQFWQEKLNRPNSTLLVLAWSFFPLVPTDLVCYVAGIVKMRFGYMLLGVFLGELILNIFYIYFGLQMSIFF